MFGMGWPEILVIGIVGVLVFGPDKLPEFARQAAQFTKALRKMAQDAKSDLSREFGTVVGDTTWKDADPRAIVRRTILDDDASSQPAPKRSLNPGERPPLDPDAT